jgi:GH25 family lysozyme M1 (1,4-beta-N-acetylmuramidase)
VRTGIRKKIGKRGKGLVIAGVIAGGALFHVAAPSEATAPSETAAAPSKSAAAPARATAPSKEATSPAAPKPYGVDVSRYDRGFDWSRDDLAFGIAKATEGVRRSDPTFTENWTRIQQNGLVRGAYHYGHPDNDPVREADHYLSAVTKAGLRPGDLLMLDLETTDGRSTRQVNDWAKRWLRHVYEKTGVKPFFYSSWSFAEQHGEQWAIHQYASTDHDHNVSSLNAAQLRDLGYRLPRARLAMPAEPWSVGKFPGLWILTVRPRGI